LNPVFGVEEVDQKPYNSSIKPMESRSRPMRFLGFSNHENGAPRQKNRLFHYPPEACGTGLQHVSEKWVERCKKCIAFQRRYFEKETVTAPTQSSDSE
jgi:hypothetical protein